MNEAIPQISVVIPLYNKRPYIRRAVDSVLAQSFGDFELIIVDDGSTDGSHEILADIAEPRVRLIRQDNAGEGAARNCGIEEARADWIAFLDADDMWFPGHLDELAALIRLYRGSGLVSTGNLEVADGITLGSIPTRPSNIRQIDYFIEAARRIGIINSSCVAVNRTAIRKCGGFGCFRAGADLEFWAKVALNYPVALSDRITSIYFRGTGGVMEEMARTPKTSVLPLGLEEISPSVKMLARALRDGAYKAPKESIEAYINSRLVATVKGAFYHRDIERARTVVNFAIGDVPVDLRFLKHFLTLPDPAILCIIDAYTAGRKFVRSSLGRGPTAA